MMHSTFAKSLSHRRRLADLRCWGAKRPLVASLINFDNAAANSGISRFQSLGAGHAVRWDAVLTTICIRNLRREAVHATYGKSAAWWTAIAKCSPLCSPLCIPLKGRICWFSWKTGG
jgi:hypothetical protein